MGKGATSLEIAANFVHDGNYSRGNDEGNRATCEELEVSEKSKTPSF